jgi:hypothetical protein
VNEEQYQEDEERRPYDPQVAPLKDEVLVANGVDIHAEQWGHE